MLQHGSGEKEEMARSSVPPQSKATLLMTRNYLNCVNAFLQNTYIKIGTIQKRLAWLLRKDDM